MKKYAALLAFILIATPVLAGDEPDEPVLGKNATRVYDSHGNHRVPFQVTVTPVTPVDPFQATPYVWNVATLRKVVVQNPTSNYLLIGASSTFNASSAHWRVDRSSLTNEVYAVGESGIKEWVTLNHATFYLLLPAGAGDQVIRGYAETD